MRLESLLEPGWRVCLVAGWSQRPPCAGSSAQNASGQSGSPEAAIRQIYRLPFCLLTGYMARHGMDGMGYTVGTGVATGYMARLPSWLLSCQIT